MMSWFPKKTIDSFDSLLPAADSGNQSVTRKMKTEALVRSNCLMTRSMAILGNKWKPIIIYTLRERTMRFGQLVVVLDLISRKVLTDTLRELEKDGIVVREQYKELPPRVEYSLTTKGRELLPVLSMLADWYKKHLVSTSGAVEVPT